MHAHIHQPTPNILLGSALMLNTRHVRIVVAILILSVFEASDAACGDGRQDGNEQCEDGNTISNDGCSSSCQCEQTPCKFTVRTTQHLASVVSALGPGSTITLSGGTYTGSGSCGWSISAAKEDHRPITIRGAEYGAPTVVDCDNAGPVVEGVVIGTHLRLEGIRFTNAMRSGSGGGVLRAELGSRIVIKGCRVTNSVGDGDGGAIFIRNSTLLVEHSHFVENSAEKNGGTLAIVDGGRGILTDSTLTLCTAENGGAVFVARASELAISNTLLSFNTAKGNKGGAVLISDNCMLNVSTSVIANNTALRGGGIMAEFSSLLGLIGSTLFGNFAGLYGGGIYLMHST